MSTIVGCMTCHVTTSAMANTLSTYRLMDCKINLCGSNVNSVGHTNQDAYHSCITILQSPTYFTQCIHGQTGKGCLLHASQLHPLHFHPLYMDSIRLLHHDNWKFLNFQESSVQLLSHRPLNAKNWARPHTRVHPCGFHPNSSIERGSGVGVGGVGPLMGIRSFGLTRLDGSQGTRYRYQDSDLLCLTNLPLLTTNHLGEPAVSYI